MSDVMEIIYGKFHQIHELHQKEDEKKSSKIMLFVRMVNVC